MTRTSGTYSSCFMRSVISWSGGKDSCYALIQSMKLGVQPAVLLNVMNETGQRSRSHGLPAPVLEQQALQAGLPLHLISSSWSDYEKKFIEALSLLKEKYALTHAVFGDIDLQAHRDWEEQVCRQAGLIPLLPLWQQPRKQLALQMLDAGINTRIVSCNHVMGKEYLGQYLTPALLDKLEAIGIDPCGENGEYHSLVTDCPLFKQPLQVHTANAEEHESYWFINVQKA